ncbi:DUF2971 domain-containing protein [Pseudomonas sp. FME51]|uniref:DUF2971 domain-containing protein n=1 Tax=Pseudomonas sp. FME51 TaxID=2742609 RepID=UPI0018682CAF|nr:DUF2971 domain-containing protein [Pseudomonas sp. FME51]
MSLYHYCSAQIFVEIISRRQIWLSSMKLSNDTMEGRLVRVLSEQIFAMDAVNLQKADQFRSYIEVFDEHFDGFGFCFSEAGDLLSQWRGYADNGAGFSIGFSPRYLKHLVLESYQNKDYFDLKQVIYDEDAQLKMLDEAMGELRTHSNS